MKDFNYHNKEKNSDDTLSRVFYHAGHKVQWLTTSTYTVKHCYDPYSGGIFTTSLCGIPLDINYAHYSGQKPYCNTCDKIMQSRIDKLIKDEQHGTLKNSKHENLT